jgi:hypothetical protein
MPISRIMSDFSGTPIQASGREHGDVGRLLCLLNGQTVSHTREHFTQPLRFSLTLSRLPHLATPGVESIAFLLQLGEVNFHSLLNILNEQIRPSQEHIICPYCLVNLQFSPTLFPR